MSAKVREKKIVISAEISDFVTYLEQCLKLDRDFSDLKVVNFDRNKLSLKRSKTNFAVHRW